MQYHFPPEKEDQVTLANWRTAPYNRWAFRHVSEIVPSAIIQNDAGKRQVLQPGQMMELPEFTYNKEKIGNEQFFNQTHTDGLVVLHQGNVVYEHYRNGMQVSDPHILMSISKSMTALVVAVLSETGVLDPEQTVESIIPELKDGGFSGATLQQLLDMRTGLSFDEDYLATSGAIIDYRKATNWNPVPDGETLSDLRSFLCTLKDKDAPHGEQFDYKSPCSDLLGWIIERATGKRFVDVFSELIWSKIGAEYPAQVTVDRLGAPRVAGGISMTTRDLARIGQLMVDDGGGVVPASWINDVEMNGDKDAWERGNFSEYFPGIPMHYRSKWYVFRDESPILFGLGIHGQNLFVDRKNKLVLAKHASHPDPIDTTGELMSLQLFRDLREQL